MPCSARGSNLTPTTWPIEKPATQPATRQSLSGQAENAVIINDAWLSEHQTKERQKTVRKLLVFGGFLLSAFVGLLIGYYIVANIIPGGNFLHLRLPGLPQ